MGVLDDKFHRNRKGVGINSRKKLDNFPHVYISTTAAHILFSLLFFFFGKGNITFFDEITFLEVQ